MLLTFPVGFGARIVLVNVLMLRVFPRIYYHNPVLNQLAYVESIKIKRFIV